VLTILSVAYPLAPASADAVGGAEQILAALDEAIVAAGHRSLVVACDGSKVAGELVALTAFEDPLTSASWVTAHEACRATLQDLLARERIDLVHMHGIDFHAYLPPPGPVVLATLHLPLDWYPPHVFDLARPETYLHGVSRAQQRNAPPSALLLDEIENGVDLERLKPTASQGEYALVLGRICPEKAPHLALDAATRAGVPLVLAGKVFGFPEHQRYFRDEIEPRLVPPHRFVGAVQGDAKARLIARARCVIVPSLVPETSSLVAMEALACGTPVIALRRGALVDLVEDGRTGALVDHPDELAAAIASVSRLSRARCRALAEARCSRTRMCERYLARYQELVTRARDRARDRMRTARIRVEIVDRGLADLEPAWAELWERSAGVTAFQRPQWCIPWYRHLLQGTPCAIAVWRGAHLEGLLPLFRWRDGDRDVLSLAGAGVSDYQDLLVAPDSDGAAEVIAAIETQLASLAWDRVELSEIREGSALLGLRIPGLEQIEDQGPCLGMTLTAAGALDVLPARLRHEIARQRRRAAREVGIESVILPAPEIAASLARLHQSRWLSRGQDGLLFPERCAFLDDAVGRMAVHGHAFGVGVRLGGELAAMMLVLVDRDTARCYLGGFNPEHERWSPGTLAIASAIEEAHARGAREIDFLRGTERYKQWWGVTDRVHLRRRVVRRG
jgi:CelD/BcsL family acetyltransferase involved in cellulose biosynthesis/glycosyltransferase involved in cell wall biosynthesis